MSSIKSLEQLINHFEDEPDSRRAEILKDTKIPLGEFTKFTSWKDGDYTRNCIVRTKSFEFIILCWDLNACTPIHGHDDKDCWVYQIDGELTEKILMESDQGLELKDTNTIQKGMVSYMHDKMGYHALENKSYSRAMSLHIYAEPIDKCKVYCEDTRKFKTLEMSYDCDYSS